jgi:hypothetical protein
MRCACVPSNSERALVFDPVRLRTGRALACRSCDRFADVGGGFRARWDSGAGLEMMNRIAAPTVGGMLNAPLLSLFAVPAAYALMRREAKFQKRPVA